MKVSVVIPAYNEEEAIGRVISDVHKTLKGKYKYDIVVVDNNSSDRTAELAKVAGANVIYETKQGYGHALFKGFKNISSKTSIVVMLDADCSYPPEAIPQLIDPIIKDEADLVIGARSIKERGSMGLLKRFGNKILNYSLGFAGLRVSDGQSGFRAMKKDVIDTVSYFLWSGGMAFIDEMLLHANELGFQIVEVPITYRKRLGKSKLNPISDGVRMLMTVTRILQEYSPLKFFGILSFIMVSAAGILASYVLYEYITISYWHRALSLVAAMLAIGGIQVFTIGLLASMIRNAFKTTNKFLVEMISKRKK